MCTGTSWKVPHSTVAATCGVYRHPNGLSHLKHGQAQRARSPIQSEESQVSGLMSPLQVSSLYGPEKGPRLSLAFFDT